MRRSRGEKFAEMFKVQKECGGIIEPKKLDVLLPGMFLPGMANASVDALDSGNQVVSIIEETNLGQGSVEATTSVDWNVPSSSTSALSVSRAEMMGDHTTVEHLEPGVRELQFGRSKNDFRMHYNQQFLMKESRDQGNTQAPNQKRQFSSRKNRMLCSDFSNVELLCTGAGKTDAALYIYHQLSDRSSFEWFKKLSIEL